MSGSDTELEAPVAPQDSAAPHTDRLSARSRRLIPRGLAVLVGVSAVAVGILGQQAIRVGGPERDGAAALDAARTGTVQVLSFDSTTLDADLARARTHISGPFVAVFEKLVASVTTSVRQQQILATRTEVARSALIDSAPDQAHVLLFLTRVASTPAQPRPEPVSLQVKVAMTRTADGQWLISEMQPL